MFVDQTRKMPSAFAVAAATSASIVARPTMRPLLPSGKYACAPPNVNS